MLQPCVRDVLHLLVERLIERVELVWTGALSLWPSSSETAQERTCMHERLATAELGGTMLSFPSACGNAAKCASQWANHCRVCARSRTTTMYSTCWRDKERHCTCIAASAAAPKGSMQQRRYPTACDIAGRRAVPFGAASRGRSCTQTRRTTHWCGRGQLAANGVVWGWACEVDAVRTPTEIWNRHRRALLLRQ